MVESTASVLAPLPTDQVDSLIEILDLVRSGQATTRPELARESGLGRSIVSQRLEQAIDYGLIAEADLGPSTGGRAPRQLRFVAERGLLLVGVFGALGVGVAVADLSGALLASFHGPWTVDAGPEKSLEHLAELFERVRGEYRDREIWGIAVGVPGPVEYSTGRPVAPPNMPGWNGFDIRGWFEQRFHAPVWVDNDVNLMAIGELAGSGMPPHSDILFVKVGSGIGAGLVSAGRLHRGANGGAGDIGHVSISENPTVPCRCGRTGCLEAVAGGWALARDGLVEAQAGRSPYLKARWDDEGVVRPIDIVNGALSGDPACVELVIKSGRVIGENVSGLVSFFNPSVLAIGGAVASAGDLFMAAVRQAVYRSALPLATRDLRIVPSTADADVALVGGAAMLIEELLERDNLKRWIGAGSPTADYRPLYARAS